MRAEERVLRLGVGLGFRVHQGRKSAGRGKRANAR